jgi:hypothetical protein
VGDEGLRVVNPCQEGRCPKRLIIFWDDCTSRGSPG